MEEKSSKLENRVTAALVIHEEHMSDYHTRLKLILHMAWAKNQSNDTSRKNLPNQARSGCTLAMSWNGNRFTERRWGVGWKEMMKCGIDGRAQKKKRTRKVAKWKQRTRRDRSVMSRVGHFAHGPAHVQKKTVVVCDVTTCSLNSECSETLEDDLQNAAQRWCGQCPCSDALAFSDKKRRNLSPSESFVKNQIACVVKMVLCGRKPRSTSSHLHYLPFSFTFFFVTSFLKKYPFRFLTFSSIFLKKYSHVLLFSFENVLPLTLSIWQNHAVFFMEGSSCFLDCLRVSFVSFLSFFFKNSSVFLKWISFDLFCVLLSYKLFFHPFFITSCFCSSRFVFTSFFIPFFVWPFIFLISFFMNSLLWTTISLLYQKPLQLFTFVYMQALPLYVLLFLFHRFVHLLSFFLFLLSLSFWNTYLTLLHFQKLFDLFVRHLHTFVCFCMFVLLSVFFFKFSFFVYSLVFFGHSPFLISFLNICFSHVSFIFVVLFECISPFFWRFSLIWLYFSCLFFPPFTHSPFFSTTTFLLNRVCCLFFLKKSFLLLPVFSLHQRKLCQWKFVLTHFETSDFELFTFTSTISTFSLLECLLCLFIPSFFVHPLSTCSLSCLSVFSRFFHFFAIFNFPFFLVLDCLFNFLFLFSSVPKKDFVCFPVCWTCFTFIFPALYCFSVSWGMVSRFCLNSPFLFSCSFSFTFITFLFWCIWKMLFFQQNGEDIFCFFLFLPFFFSSFFCSLVFFFFEKVCVIDPFIFELFLEFLVNPFSLSSHFSHEKISPETFIFCFCSVPFLFHFCFQHFSLFSIITFSFIIFPSFLFVHPFLLFSSFSPLTFLHSFFISLSQCFSFSFFLYLMFTHLFSPSPFLRILLF